MDAQTLALIQALQSQFATPQQAWQGAMDQRQQPQFFNSPQMRNAEHYLSANVPGQTFPYGMMAAPYLATKMFEGDPMGQPMMTPATRAQSPDPMGELKWGMLPMLQRLGLAK